MTRKMSLKEAFDLLYKQSNEYDLEKTLMYDHLNTSKTEQAKKTLCTINLNDSYSGCSTEKLGLKVKGLSWKTRVYRRLRSARARRVKNVTLRKQHLRDITDRLHFVHFVGDSRYNADKIKSLMHRHKRKSKSMGRPFLVRNVKKMKRLLKVPVDEEREGFNLLTPRKINNKTLALHVHNIQSDRKTPVPSTHKHFTGKTGKVQTNFDSGYYELEEIDQMVDQSIHLKLPLQTPRKQTHLENQSESLAIDQGIHLKLPLQTPRKQTHLENKSESLVKSHASEFNTKKGRSISNDKKLSIPEPSSLKQDNSSSSTMEKRDLPKKRVTFRPLFSSHCGGAWKQIVEEN